MELLCWKHAVRELKNKPNHIGALIRILPNQQLKGMENKCSHFCKDPVSFMKLSVQEKITIDTNISEARSKVEQSVSNATNDIEITESTTNKEVTV